MTRRLETAEALQLAEAACRGAGANEANAVSLARATVAAETFGKPEVGFAHLIDYLRSLREGRIDGDATPAISYPAPALAFADARGGIAQLGFDLVEDELVARAREYGVALFAERNCYTAGEVGYYPRRLAERGLVSLAAANGPPLVAPPGAARAVYCTNPIAFAAPGVDQRPALVIDQSTSATAFVKVREAAARGDLLPEGVAIDAAGAPTRDPVAALTGALLTFGGARGANIALIVEILAAGFTGANWSLEAPDFRRGDRSPGVGLLVIAVAADKLDPAFAPRLQRHLDTLQSYGVYTPGRTRGVERDIVLPIALYEAIAAFAATGM